MLLFWTHHPDSVSAGDKHATPAQKFLQGHLPQDAQPALAQVDKVWNMMRQQASGVPAGTHGLFLR